MGAVGIIAEFNPFHNGHEYLINKAKEITGCDYAVVVMSGNFVQRGAPAMCNKYLRTEMALKSGADIIFEIPVVYATATAEVYARAAVKLLMSFKNCDVIVFGSECGNIELLWQIAEALNNEDEVFSKVIKSELKLGKSYPSARKSALSASLNNPSLANILDTPNNILGVEYCRALLEYRIKFGFNPSVMTIPRLGSTYHDSSITSTFASASGIRNLLENTTSFDDTVKRLVPEKVHILLKNDYHRTLPVVSDDFSQMLFLSLCSNPIYANEYSKYLDTPFSFTSLTEAIKKKNLTYTSISRALLHALLGIDEAAYISYLNSFEKMPYLRLLGLNRDASGLLKGITDDDTVLITKLADAPRDITMLNMDILAAHLYNQVVYSKFGTIIKSEYEHSPIIV